MLRVVLAIVFSRLIEHGVDASGLQCFLDMH
jgi:hypothetical protein